jgi:Uma2 family endonuclease
MNFKDPSGPSSGSSGVSSRPEPWISPEQYLAAERLAETRSEYLDGQVFAMSGASLPHNRIVVNLVVELGRQLKGGPCSVLASDMRLRVPSTGLYTYPDVTVVCGEPQLEDEHFDTLLNPTVLIEVLSPSTERYDRGRKGVHYRRIASLAEFLLVAQDEPRVERYRRQGEGEWVLTEVSGLEESVALDSLGCVFALRDVYDRVFQD